MLTLKPPGVSGSRIGVITKICVENVQVRLLTRLSHRQCLVTWN